MDNVGSLKVEITGDASGLTAALNQAKSGLSGFVETAGAVAAGVGLAGFAQQVVGDLKNIGETSLTSAANFETVSTSLGNLLGNVSSGTKQAADDMGGLSGKAATTALEIQDTMITFQEKMTAIQDEIADVMKGQNILDAQQQLTQQLDDLAESHAQKVLDLNDKIDQSYQDLADKEAQREQSMTDTLADMQATHANQTADKKEALDQKLSKTTSQVAKDALIKQFNEQQQLADDSFQRQYNLKKAQLERNNAEQAAQDKKAADQHIATLQAQINDENTAYDKQEAKLQSDSDTRIEQFKEENAKKLAAYKQELDDEVRAHEIQMQKLQQSAAGAATSNGPADVTAASGFAEQAQTVEQMMSFINGLAPHTPFTFPELSTGARQLTAFGLNAEKLLPVIGNISSGMGQSLATGVQAVTDAMEGNTRMMKQDLGINQSTLEQFGAKFNKQGQIVDMDSFFAALDKMQQKGGPFFDAMTTQMHTVNGALSNLQDNWFRFTMAFLGINTGTGKAGKGSLFGDVESALVDLSQYLNAHSGQIIATLSNYGKAIDTAFRDTTKFIQDHKTALETIAVVVITLLTPGMILLAATMAKNLVTSIVSSTIELSKFIIQSWGTVASILGQIVEITISIGLWIAHAVAVTASTVVTGALTAATWLLNAALAVLTSPITLVVLAIVALIAIGYELIKHWSDVKQIGVAVWETIGDVIKSAVNLAIGALNKLGEALDKVTFGKVKFKLDTFKTDFGKDLGDIGSSVSKLGGDISTDIGSAISSVSGLVSSAASQLGGLLGGSQLSSPSVSPVPSSFNSSNYGNTNNVTLSNQFNVNSPANASNAAAYLALQLDHLGLT